MKKHKNKKLKPEPYIQPATASVLDELKKARAKHKAMTSPHEGISVIHEEFEELWDHVKADTGKTPEARHEAVQLAAMAIRYIEDVVDQHKVGFGFSLDGLGYPLGRI